MQLANQTHMTALRQLLSDRLQHLRAEVHAAEQASRASGEGGAHEVADHKDEAAQQQFADLDSAQQQRDINEIAEVEAALHRLDAGSYGECADCGEPIPLPRLLVQPAARRCAECQSAREHRPR